LKKATNTAERKKGGEEPSYERHTEKEGELRRVTGKGRTLRPLINSYITNSIAGEEKRGEASFSCVLSTSPNGEMEDKREDRSTQHGLYKYKIPLLW